MQLRLKGFVGIEPLISNVEGVTAPIGEISTKSLTYAKDVGIYNASAFPTLTYYSFHSKDGNGVKVAPVPAIMQGHIFQITDWIKTSQGANGSPQTREDFLAAFVAQWGATSTGLNCGELVEIQTGFKFPEWVSFQKTNLDPSNGIEANLTTIWYADESFQSQFDDFDITVVPPVANLEVFFSGKAQVLAALAAQGIGATLQRLQDAKEGHPETIASGENFDWVDPATLTRTPTNWSLLIYGAAGDDLDAIRQAIRDYIAANSTRSEDEWKVIFPDIYKNTEFVIFPRWKLWAIPDRQLYEGTHSPVVKLQEALDYLTAAIPAFPAPWIKNHATAMPCNYKSLTLLLTSSPDNRVGTTDIIDLYPDILNIPTSDTLWESMAQDTRDFLEGLQAMVMTAENMGPYTDVPVGQRRTTRAGIIYVSKRFKDVNYLVASKSTAP